MLHRVHINYYQSYESVTVFIIIALLIFHSDGDVNGSVKQTDIVSHTKAVIQGLEALKTEHNQVI